MQGSNLTGATLCGTGLMGADVRGAIFLHTRVTQMDLRWTRRVKLIEHRDSSHVELGSVDLPGDEPIFYAESRKRSHYS